MEQRALLRPLSLLHNMLARSDEMRINPEYIVRLVFYMIAEIVLLGSVFGSCLMRRPMHDPEAIPFKSLFISLLSQIMYRPTW